MNNWIDISDMSGNEKEVINLSGIIKVCVDTTDEDNHDWGVWVMYPNSAEWVGVYNGTQVESLRIYDKITERLNPAKLTAWQ